MILQSWLTGQQQSVHFATVKYSVASLLPLPGTSLVLGDIPSHLVSRYQSYCWCCTCWPNALTYLLTKCFALPVDQMFCLTCWPNVLPYLLTRCFALPVDQTFCLTCWPKVLLYLTNATDALYAIWCLTKLHLSAVCEHTTFWLFCTYLSCRRCSAMPTLNCIFPLPVVLQVINTSLSCCCFSPWLATGTVLCQLWPESSPYLSFCRWLTQLS